MASSTCKTALILGGTRFFRKNLVHALLSKSVEVTVATRGKASDPFGNRVRRVTLDRENPRSGGRR